MVRPTIQLGPASNGGAVVVEEPQRGYGAACLRGLAYLDEQLQERDLEIDVVVFLDADYSDHPEELPQLVKPILDGEADFVLGSRMLGRAERGALLPQARFGNRLACLLMRCLFGAKQYTDLGPFRAIRYDRLTELQMCDRNFGWTIEMQIKAHLAGLRIREVPAAYRHRVGTSKITGDRIGNHSSGLQDSRHNLYVLAAEHWPKTKATYVRTALAQTECYGRWRLRRW